MVHCRPLARQLAGAFLSVVTIFAAPQAIAQDDWKWSAEVYGWMPKIDASTSSGFGASLDFDTILDDLNFTFMGNIAAKRDRWTFFTDLIWLDISDTDQGSLQVGPVSVPGQLSWKSRTFIGTAGAAYEVAAADNYKFNVLGGARYLWMKVNAGLLVGPVTGTATDKETYLDGIVGINGEVDINDKWYFSYYADVGTGDSDLTWQALAAVSYRFEKFDLAVGYRHLNWDFNDGPLGELTVDGPYIGARFDF